MATYARVCCRCGKTKPLDLEHFLRDNRFDGFSFTCRECFNKSERGFDDLSFLRSTLHQKLRRGVNRKGGNVTLRDVMDLYVAQSGKCAISKRPLEVRCDHSVDFEGCKSPWVVSIDRIDSNKPYDVDNVQLICAVYNFMKHDLSMSFFVYCCSLAMKAQMS